MDMMTGRTKYIHVKMLEHKTNGLFVAVSDDVKGLYVSGQSEDQVLERLPRVMKMLLEAREGRVMSIDLVQDPEMAGFLVKGPTYAAEMAG
jgi:hypothetical protein